MAGAGYCRLPAQLPPGGPAAAGVAADAGLLVSGLLVSAARIRRRRASRPAGAAAGLAAAAHAAVTADPGLVRLQHRRPRAAQSVAEQCPCAEQCRRAVLRRRAVGSAGGQCRIVLDMGAGTDGDTRASVPAMPDTRAPDGARPGGRQSQGRPPHRAFTPVMPHDSARDLGMRKSRRARGVSVCVWGGEGCAGRARGAGDRASLPRAAAAPEPRRCAARLATAAKGCAAAACEDLVRTCL